MNFQEAMKALEDLGSEQTRKTYRRHGTPEPLFGVSFAALAKLKKYIKQDPALAEALWASRNADARYLATMITDPQKISEAVLDAWAEEIGYHTLADLFVMNVVFSSPHAVKKVAEWTPSDDEWRGRLGWGLVAALAAKEQSLPDAFFEGLLPNIEAGIHQAKNRKREAMNNALIAIGSRSAGLAGKAIAAARRIGKVEVDHGDTSCKTPDAIPYIEKSRAHKESSAKKKGSRRS